MKRFLKNAVLIMLVSSFMLNVVNLVIGHVRHYNAVLEISALIRQINEGEIVIENTYQSLEQLFATVYMAGMGEYLAIQTGIIVLSIVLGITIGLIITFEEKSKIRVVIIYVLGLLLTALAPTICDVIYYMDFNGFFKDMIYYLENIWKWYTLAFFIIYAIKIYVNHRKAKELNEVLSKKQNDLEKIN